MRKLICCLLCLNQMRLWVVVQAEELTKTATKHWVVVQAEELTKTATKQRKRLDLSLTSTWRSFQDLIACLVASNALQADTLKALPLGHVARQIHGDNELWLAIVLTHPAVQVSHESLWDVVPHVAMVYQAQLSQVTACDLRLYCNS